MPRIFINLEAGCLQVNLMNTSARINQLKYTILYYYYTILYYTNINNATLKTVDVVRDLGVIINKNGK